MAKRGTKGADYTERLVRLEKKRWKDVLDVQRPYRWNIKRLNPGVTLEVGCGIGRLLKHLPHGSIGVDHNAHSIKMCRDAGMIAFKTNEFMKSKYAKKNYYDSILLAHVIEHMTPEDNVKMLNSYLPFLKKDGKVIIICPQEKGFATDHTHVALYDFDDLSKLLKQVNYEINKKLSFPFPRFAGKIFTYNEFVITAKAN